jgi:hypothetical protein
MSEKSEIPPLDPVAFVAALILAPLLFTALTFWAVLIPVGALIVGGLPYLVLGAPILLVMLFHGRCEVERMARAAIFTITVPFAPIMVGSLLLGGDGALALFALGVACMTFAAGWAATFASLYNRFYRNPVI